MGDTGCDKSVMSEDFFLANPHLRTRPYRPLTTRGRAINGSKILTMGIVNVSFRINGRFYSTNFRIVRGLVHDIFLGWDWLTAAGAVINTVKGLLEFPKHGDSIPLAPTTPTISGCYYRMPEDFVVPPNSKAHTTVELMLNGNEQSQITKVVEVEPFQNAPSDIWCCRCIDTVKDGMFMTEFINPHEYSIKLEKGRVLGYVNFTSDDELANYSVHTDMYCHYGSDDDSGYESNDQSEADSDGEPDCDDDGDVEEIQVDPNPTQGMSCTMPPCPPQDTPPPNTKTTDTHIPPGAKPLKADLSKIAKEAIPYKEQLRELIEVKHPKAFSRHDRDYGKTHLVHYRAHIKKDEAPIAVPPYRTRPEMRKTIDDQAYQMIADGVIGHSISPFSAPIMLARKKCGGWRFLTDFRKVNEKCEKVVYPLPRIEDSLQRLNKPRFFTSLDLTKGFWQIPVHPEDRKFFAFSTETMHLEYLVAPMGAKNSPAALCALMQLVLRGLPAEHVISYLDDILVATETMEDHIFYLDKVFAALERANLKLNPAKCSFARDSVVCLGHKLSKDGVAPDPANIAKIEAWQPPTNARKLKTFLGLTGYYRMFVKDYSKIAQCLTDLTHDDAEWTWKAEHQQAFETLKNILISDAVMAYPDFSKPFTIKSDASTTAIGYVLTQQVDGKEKVISYGSKKLTPTQQGWATYDREFFALLCAVRANAHYLRHAPFTAITDHRPLLSWRKINAGKDPTGRRTRWSIELDTYDFNLIYKQGRIHSDADAMSRLGGENDEEAQDDEEFAFLGLDSAEDYSAAKFNVSDTAIANLRKAQDEDETISQARNFIANRKRIPRTFPESWYKTYSRWLTVQKGVLYKRAYCQSTHSQILQAIIPEPLTNEILKNLHGNPMAGHPCAEKMLLKVKRYAIWPTIHKDIQLYVQNCKICDQERDPVPKSKTPRVPLEAKNVWDWVVCDLLMLPNASAGYRYVLVFIDVFSGFVKLYKLKTKDTIGVCKAFENLVCLIGPPRLLSSDNGKEFTSELLTNMCKVVGAQKRTSVPYRPQSQGTVERFNRTLIKDLRKRLIQYGRSWIDHLPYVEWSYNTTPRSNDQMCPYLIMYGRDPPLPTFVDVDQFAVTNKDLRQYFQKMKNRSKEIYDEARRRMILHREKEVAAYNKGVKHTPLKPGDKVFEHIPEGLRNKLQPKWDNLMEIVKQRKSRSGKEGITYVCRKQNGSECVKHYEQLKKSRASDELTPLQLRRQNQHPK